MIEINNPVDSIPDELEIGTWYSLKNWPVEHPCIQMILGSCLHDDPITDTYSKGYMRRELCGYTFVPNRNNDLDYAELFLKPFVESDLNTLCYKSSANFHEDKELPSYIVIVERSLDELKRYYLNGGFHVEYQLDAGPYNHQSYFWYDSDTLSEIAKVYAVNTDEMFDRLDGRQVYSIVRDMVYLKTCHCYGDVGYIVDAGKRFPMNPKGIAIRNMFAMLDGELYEFKIDEEKER